MLRYVMLRRVATRCYFTANEPWAASSSSTRFTLIWKGPSDASVLKEGTGAVMRSIAIYIITEDWKPKNTASRLAVRRRKRKEKKRKEEKEKKRKEKKRKEKKRKEKTERKKEGGVLFMYTKTPIIRAEKNWDSEKGLRLCSYDRRIFWRVF